MDDVVNGRACVGSVRDDRVAIVAAARLAQSVRHGVVDQVSTRPRRQRRGLGTALLTLLADRALDAGLTTGQLSPTAGGRALYSNLGWAARGEVAGAYRRRRPARPSRPECL
jgi:GNAT superfamily N-acetyltransferase